MAFPDIVRPGNVVAQLEDGVRFGAAVEEAAQIGRRQIGRTMPAWGCALADVEPGKRCPGSRSPGARATWA